MTKQRQFVPPTRHLDHLIQHMESYVQLANSGKLGYQVPYYEEYLLRLRSPECKRLLVDARQALLFDELQEPPPENIQRRIHPPFPMFYMEFTEPILLQAQEPGQRDYARAILFAGSDVVKHQVRFAGKTWPTDNAVIFMTTIDSELPDAHVMRGPMRVQPSRALERELLSPRAPGMTPYNLPPGMQHTGLQFVDRAWTLRLSEGMALSRVIDARQAGSEVPDDWEDLGYFPAGMDIPMFKDDRAVSWWEESIMSHTGLLSWMCAYIMAKGVHVVEQPVSRQVRRWHERKERPLPAPWHVVKVEPKFSHGRPTGQVEGSAHSYRYDVIGHLRYGKHPRKDGSFSETIEWVPPHQRGLANDLYIPKTYKVERGKVVSPLMRRYYGEMAAVGKEA